MWFKFFPLQYWLKKYCITWNQEVERVLFSTKTLAVHFKSDGKSGIPRSISTTFSRRVHFFMFSLKKEIVEEHTGCHSTIILSIFNKRIVKNIDVSYKK